MLRKAKYHVACRHIANGKSRSMRRDPSLLLRMTTLISIALAVVSLLLPPAAHATKTLNLAVNAAESTFDPAASDDIPSSDMIVMMLEQIGRAHV